VEYASSAPAVSESVELPSVFELLPLSEVLVTEDVPLPLPVVPLVPGVLLSVEVSPFVEVPVSVLPVAPPAAEAGCDTLPESPVGVVSGSVGEVDCCTANPLPPPPSAPRLLPMINLFYE
jgi:hypothetical protein